MRKGVKSGNTALQYSDESSNLRTDLNKFINSLNKWKVITSMDGGSHKRYRKSSKSCKYKSRKQSRRHIQYSKRTHRYKSLSSRK